MTVVMCSSVGNLKMFEGSRVPKVKGWNRNKSTRGLSKIKGETPLPLKRGGEEKKSKRKALVRDVYSHSHSEKRGKASQKVYIIPSSGTPTEPPQILLGCAALCPDRQCTPKNRNLD